MLSGPSIEQLLEYTDWERAQWLAWILRQDGRVLEMNAGPSGDGRFQTVGDLVRHVFSAEKRYVERLSDRPITDTAQIHTNDVEALFAFGRSSRRDLRQYVEGLTNDTADVPFEFPLMNKTLLATPRKIVTHVLMHEIRHWAQIATLLRVAGLKVEFHDFLFSPVMGGEMRREQHSA